MNLIRKVFNFYLEGFKNMGPLGRKLWIIILIKLFIMFAVLRLFFFPDFLNSNFKTDEERGNHVLEQLIKNK